MNVIGNVIDTLAGHIDELRVSSVVRYAGPFDPQRRHAPDATTVLEVDGVVVDEGAAPTLGIVVNDQPLCLGAFAGGSRAFIGDIDDVRIELD